MSGLRSIKRGMVKRRMKEEGINHRAMSQVWRDKKFMKRLLQKGVR